MKSSEQTDKIHAALAKFQETAANVLTTKRADMGSHSYNYASIDDVLTAIRPKLAEAGLAVIQGSDAEARGMCTRVMHTSGQFIETFMAFPLGGNKPQAAGGSITYARRYALLAALGIAATGDDDDAKAAQFEGLRAELVERPRTACVQKLIESGAEEDEAHTIVSQFMGEHEGSPTKAQWKQFYSVDLKGWQPAAADALMPAGGSE